MTVFKSSNISVSDLRKYLTCKQARKIRTKGGHEIWCHSSLNRSITFQSHIETIPEFIVNQIIGKFNDSKEDFHNIINPEKGTKERKADIAKKGKRSNKDKKK